MQAFFKEHASGFHTVEPHKVWEEYTKEYYRMDTYYGKVRVYVTTSVQAKFTIAFIASCMRYELQTVAKELNRSTTEIIQDMNQLYMTRFGESYVPVQGLFGRQEYVFKSLGSSSDILKDIAKDENDRIAGRKPTPRHRKTGPNHKKVVVLEDAKTEMQNDKKTNRKKKSKGGKKPGVKPGTKRSSTNKDGSVRKSPGVPKGTKRGLLNKDGSPWKKPGPKPKVAQIGEGSEHE